MSKQATIVRTIIIEDDPISLKLIKELLQRFAQIEVIAEATTYSKAEKALNDNKDFDLLIADIDLNGHNLLDLIQHINPKTNIIFITGHSNFAVKAFEYNTIDYIIKPITYERLKKALSRIKLINGNGEHNDADDNEQHEAKGARLGYENMLLINFDNGLRFIKVKDINYIEAKGNYTTVHLVNGTSITSYGLIKVWEDKLPEDDFLRIHRSTIVNLHNVDKIEKGNYDTGLLYLNGVEKPFEISRSYFTLIKSKYKLSSNLFH